MPASKRHPAPRTNVLQANGPHHSAALLYPQASSLLAVRSSKHPIVRSKTNNVPPASVPRPGPFPTRSRSAVSSGSNNVPNSRHPAVRNRLRSRSLRNPLLRNGAGQHVWDS